jgi:hypothetical protein
MSVELPTAGRRRGRNRRPADRPWITLESQFMASTKWVPLHVASAVGSEPRIISDQSPLDASAFFLLPRGSTPIPMIAVGSGGQSVDWIARNAIGWMTYHREPETQRARHSM